MAIFNILTGRKCPTFSPVHYWDICSDTYAALDAQRILADPPSVIVYEEFPPSAWHFHEAAFRNGKPSGLRKIDEAIRGVVTAYGYNLVREWHSRHRAGFPIRVWVRPRPGIKESISIPIRSSVVGIGGLPAPQPGLRPAPRLESEGWMNDD